MDGGEYSVWKAMRGCPTFVVIMIYTFISTYSPYGLQRSLIRVQYTKILGEVHVLSSQRI